MWNLGAGHSEHLGKTLALAVPLGGEWQGCWVKQRRHVQTEDGS